MTTQQFSTNDIKDLSPQELETAINNSRPNTPEGINSPPKNLQQVFSRTSAYGTDFATGNNAQIIKEAGLTQLFDIATGVSSFVPLNLLTMKLKQITEDGVAVWTTKQDEAAARIIPAYPCLLHLAHAMRERADSLGFPVCKKMLTNPQDSIDHSKKHTRAWASFERDKIDDKEARAEEWQHTAMAAVTDVAMNRPSDSQMQMIEKACIECGDSVFATNLESVSIKLQVHMRQHLSPKSFEASNSMGSPTIFDTPFTPYPEPEMPTPNSAQELLLAKVQNFPGWCKEPDCEFVTDSKSASGAKISLSYHVRKEHPND